MNKYKVIIQNSAGCEIYNEIITAEDENKAVIKVLGYCTIYSEDTISVEEI